jgi:hypothetical protein
VFWLFANFYVTIQPMLQILIYRGDARGCVPPFLQKRWRQKTCIEDRRKSSRFTIENGEIYLLRLTSIVLRVHLMLFINKEFALKPETR